MIITLTMNPALDRTEYEDGRIVCDPGGKGINVSKVLKSLGVDSLAMGPVGGAGGETLQRELDLLGIPYDFTRIAGETRTNVKKVDRNGQTTEHNAPGPVLTKAEQEEVRRTLLDRVRPEDLVVLSGSMPKGVEPEYLADLIRSLREKRAKVFLDTSGKTLETALQAGPDYVKPNEEEYEALTASGIPVPEGTVCVISYGDRGAEFRHGRESFFVRAPKVNCQSAVGAGDALLAGLVTGIFRGLSARQCAALAVACGSAAVETVGTRPGSADRTDWLYRQILCDMNPE